MPATPPRTIQALLIGAMVWAPCVAQGQGSPGQFTLYRCGPQGRELRNTPCPLEAGASQLLQYDAADPAAAAQARERARQEGQLAERLSRERDARTQAEQEALRRAPAAVLIGPVSPLASRASRAASASAAAVPDRASPERRADPRRHRPTGAPLQSPAKPVKPAKPATP